MKKSAIFDMDGLLFDTERLYRESWVEMAKQFGQVPNPAFPPAVAGTNGEHMAEVVRAYYPAIDEWDFISKVLERVAGIAAQGAPEKPGMREILEYFHANGVKMAVASRSKKEVILTNLRSAGIEHYFDAVVSGDEAANSKPAPDIFLLAAKQLGTAAEDCYVFEDGINGARAGIAAGCVTIMVPDETPPTEDLRKNCAGICNSLHEAREAIMQGRL